MKRLARIQEEAALSQAAIAAQTQDALARVQARELERYCGAELRITGGYDLADHTVSRATSLNHLVTQTSRDNPGLELRHRGIEDTVDLGARIIIQHYMTGR
jgi:hypothetical protein